MNRTFSLLCLILAFLCCPLHGHSQSFEFSLEWAMSKFAFIEKIKNFVEDIDLNKPAVFPLGMRKMIANVPATVAITNMRFYPEYAEATVLVKVEVPQQSRILVFGAENIQISFDGNLIGDIKLALLSNVTIPLGEMGNLIIKGSLDDKTGRGNSETFLSLDCNAEFKKLSLGMELEMNPGIFVPAGSGKNEPKTLTSSFKAEIENWNHFLVEISLAPFEIKSLEGFTFEVKKATLDLSDYENPAAFSAPKNYFRDYCSYPDKNQWRGVFIDKFSLVLPPEFKIKDSSERIALEGENLLIDENGLSGGVSALDVLPLEKGDANGWAFSVTDLELFLTANKITGFGFGGELGIPLTEKIKTLRYSALIEQGGKYLFKVNLGEKLSIDMFGTADVYLEKTSYVQMLVEDQTFKPSLVMNGYMQISAGKALHLEKFIFKKLTVSTESPYLSVESLDCEGDLRLAHFPLSIENISLKASGKKANLDFDVKILLMKNKISARSTFGFSAEYADKHWKYKGFDLDKIILDSIALQGFTLSGSLLLEEDDKEYGDYIGGSLEARFNILSDELKLKASAHFGCKDSLRYWFVEGDAGFPGIPVGPLSINGFCGGAYYKVRAKGDPLGKTTYVPDEKCGLGIRAGMSFSVADKKIANGNALFEVCFLNGGGIGKTRFYGQLKLMDRVEVFDNVRELYTQAAQNFNDMSESLSSRLPKGLSGSEIAQMVYPAKKKKDGITAYLTMEYDFPTRSFDANFSLSVNVAGGLIHGTGAGDAAGAACLHISPGKWYIHAGTPAHPIGLQVGFGKFSVQSGSYLMIGDDIPVSPAPPALVTQILGLSAEEVGYTKDLDQIGLGKGFAFGSNLSFDTGNMNFLILYARFASELGFDLMLKDYSDYYCEGKNEKIGIDGWYANGQCYAALLGELGVNIKILGLKKTIPVIRGATAALLQAKLPNPTWFGGYMAVEVNILGGLLEGRMRMKISLGDDCKIVRADGEYSPVEMPMISDLSPNQSGEVDVFTSPQATFSMPVGKAFNLDDESGTRTYRIQLAEFVVKNASGQLVEGNIRWNTKKDEATFISKEILSPKTQWFASVSVRFEEYANGNWQVVRQSGKDAVETKKVSFKTGNAPDRIPLTNIAYCYPVVDQKNFYQNESATGYIQLKKGQRYLFPEGFVYQAKCTRQGVKTVPSSFTYDEAQARITFSFPEKMGRESRYYLRLAAASEWDGEDENESMDEEQGAESPEETIDEDHIVAQKIVLEDQENGADYELLFKQKMAQRISQSGSMELLNYRFESSRYATFEEKLSDMQLTGTTRYVNSDIRSLLLQTETTSELLDQAELTGTVHTAGLPLVQAEALLNDAYFLKDIKPLIYDWYPYPGITIRNRLPDVLGVPPVRAVPLLDGYLYAVSSGIYQPEFLHTWPYIYSLPLYYQQDYHDLKTQVINSFLHTGYLAQWKFLIDSYFPFIPKGSYVVRFSYVLPGGQPGTTKDLDYHNPIDWRE